MVSKKVVISTSNFLTGKFISRHALWSQLFGLCDLSAQKRNAKNWLMWVKILTQAYVLGEENYITNYLCWSFCYVDTYAKQKHPRCKKSEAKGPSCLLATHNVRSITYKFQKVQSSH